MEKEELNFFRTYYDKVVPFTPFKKNASKVFKMLKDLSKEKLVIVVTHDEEFASKYGDIYLELKEGKLYEIFNEDVQLGVAKEYFDSQRISLRESFNNCDATYMKKNEEKIEIFIRTLKYFDLLDKKSNLAIANDLILKSSNQKEQIDSILELVKNQKSHIRYRTYLGLSMIGEKTNLLHNNYEDLCYKEIKEL